MSRTQPSPLPRATTLWTEPSPLPRAMMLRTEPSPRPRATTSRTQLSLRTREKTSRRQPSPRPRAMTLRTQLSPRPRATMSVFGSASLLRRPWFGPCLICFPLRLMPVIASSTRITPITLPSSIARERERHTYCIRAALWDYSNFYPPSNTSGRRHSQVQVRERRLQWSGGRRRGGKRRRGGTTNKDDDASKPPTTLTLRPTTE